MASTLQTKDIAALGDLPTLSSTDDTSEVTWKLEGPAGKTHEHLHTPRLGCTDFSALREAAIAGLGVAFLPDHSCAAALRSGALTRIFPDWYGQDGIVHVVFTTRRGLPAVVRAWIDHLALRFRDPSLFDRPRL